MPKKEVFIMDNIFSWQEENYDLLCKLFQDEAKLLFIYGRDFESPYHVLNILSSHLIKNGFVRFQIGSEGFPCLAHPFMPFAQAAKQVSQKKYPYKALLPSIVKDITKLDTIAALVESTIKQEHSSVLLRSYETELLLQLECSAGKNIPIFFFYYYGQFDESSRNLVILLVSEKLNNDFPFLKRARYVFLCEESEDSESMQNIKNIKHIDVFLSNPKPENMGEILDKLAPDLPLSQKEQEKLFYLSGGRLSIINILTRYLRSTNKTSTDFLAQNAVAATIEKRISNMGTIGTAVSTVLEYAANMGNAFPISILKQATDIDVFESALKRSDQEFFTKCSEDSGNFTCHEVQDFFYECPNKAKRREISHALERAVYYFNPYDYMARAHYLENAEDYQNACEVYYLAYNSLVQEGIVPNKALESKITNLSKYCNIESFWNSLLSVYTAINKLDFESAIYILETMPDICTTRILLLTEYLKGLCLHRFGDHLSTQQDAILTIKSAIDHAYGVEDGLWCDCQNILLSFSVNICGDINTAKSINKELTYYYMSKQYAPFAQNGLYALKRKYGALYSVERAVIKTAECVTYFREHPYLSQLVMALNNHAANLLALGDYENSIEYSFEAMQLIQKHPKVNINKMYVINNYFLAAILLGKIQPKEVYKRLLLTIDNMPFGDWSIIFQINCAIYTALAGDLIYAERIFRQLNDLNSKIKDDYYTFYINSNLASVLFLEGKKIEAIRLLKEKCTLAPSLSKPTEKACLEKRTASWISVMKSTTIKDPNLLDTYLLEKIPQKTQMSFICRGFLYSDIQFWSEP